MNSKMTKVGGDGGPDAGQGGQLVVHWQVPPTACPRFQITPARAARKPDVKRRREIALPPPDRPEALLIS
jgi:hypothetical protein